MAAGTTLAMPLDTDADAHAAQTEIYRRMGGAARVAVMYRLNAAVRDLAMAGIRARHAGYTDTQVEHAYLRLVLGDELVREVWPTRDLVDP